MRQFALGFIVIISTVACSAGRVGSADAVGSDAEASTGTDGFTGSTDGTTGTDATTGADGATGTDATTGADGTTGTDATSGTAGTDTTDGTDGTTGFTGTTGITGSTAMTGTDGMDAVDTGPTSVLVDQNCLDGQYSEQVGTGNEDFSGALQASDPTTKTIGILQARYPIGAHLVQTAQNEKVNGTQMNCVEFFLQSYGTDTQGVLDGLGTVVHECGHAANTIDLFNPSYIIRPDLVFKCKGGSIPDFGGKTFARSLIKSDKYSSLHTPCKSFSDQNCDDTYAGIYLDGDPNNAAFESGDQGFDTVLEETVQYVNSLAVARAMLDQSGPFTTSDRDGILTFLWYVERYLRMARLDFPATYKLLSENQCWRESILTVWGRAWLYLELTENESKLGIDDAKLEGLVTDPELLGEIAALRKLQGCN